MNNLVQDYLEPLLKYQKRRCFEEENEVSNETEHSYLRFLPDMSEGLIGLCIGDIMGILSFIDSSNNLTLQQQHLLKIFIETLLKTSKSSFSIFKLSILYLYKINKKIREPTVLQFYKNNIFKNTLSMKPLNQAKLIFVVILMIAFKYTEDHCFYISAWSKATGIKSEVIHKVEVEVLNILDHNLFVSQEKFEAFSNRIVQKINKMKIDLLQSVKISYASSNYSSSSEEEATNSDSSLFEKCRKCCCKRKQDCVENSSSLKKRKINNSLSVDTTDNSDADNTATFYGIPSTLYDYYRNKNENEMTKQPLTPPTPNTYTIPNPVQAPTIIPTDNLLKVDSLIIPSTPPTSQTSIFEDIEREEEIKKNREREYEEEKKLQRNSHCSSMAFILNPDENKIQFDSGENACPNVRSSSSSMAFILNPDENKIQFDSGKNENCNTPQKFIPYRYHNSPKSNFAYNNIKKVNLLEKKNEKTRTMPSIVLPNTSPVGEVASVFPSLSMISKQHQQQQQQHNECNTIEDTNNKPKSIGLQSLLNQNTFTTKFKSIVVGESENSMSNTTYPLVRNNFINIRNDDTKSIHHNNFSYLNQICPRTDEDINKQKILLSIYNCYAMRNIRHYQA
ncbi:hypothetical protein BCR36DRAFT_585581 [Piromyces finnis]|uniref:Cyclin N-terminal domain-containing protein n=1 Tax=Piromyces finnis TaxID=1754191 RepID=A0A1Y1V3B5_9FUNG|nr:hypothetical protein BCR36DRAFT_585581 [Piromyces finnis]|eukprot:ORX45554.1 hypothetical protein BCR36DRAFT_585581 [Piromyces finnis]